MSSDRTDPGGKRVDVIRTPEYLLFRFFIPDVSNTRDVLQALAVELLTEPQVVGHPAFRDQTFTLWWGEFDTRVGPRRAIGFPEGLDDRVYDAIAALTTGAMDHGINSPGDARAEPLTGYSNGHVVAYVDPFIPSGTLGCAELRSADVIGSLPPDPERVALQPLPVRHGPIYSPHAWADAADAMWTVLDELQAAGTYESLRRLVEEDLQIQVVERADAEFPTYGRILSDWSQVTADGGVECAARIELRNDLSLELRYVVLAHELAHFILHFPLLIAAQIVEEYSWNLPELELAWRVKIASALPATADFERETDRLAVFFLVPKYCFPLRRLTDRMSTSMTHGVGPQEVLWNVLQPLFPGSARPQFSWAGLDDQLQLARADLFDRQRTPLSEQGLYARMLTAGLANEALVGERLRGETSTTADLLRLLSWVNAAAGDLLALSASDLQRHAANLARELKGRQESAGLDGLVSGRRRKVLAPLAVTGAAHPKRLPLIPADVHSTRDIELWTCPIVDAEASPIEAWRGMAPDRAVIVYS